MSLPFNYGIFSTLPERYKLGITSAPQPPGAQPPVLLDGDKYEWFASRNIVGGGPTELGVGGYPSTGALNEVVVATILPEVRRVWDLRLVDEAKQTYIVAFDPESDLVWTAGEVKQPIRLEPLRPDDASQVFLFIPALK